MMAMSLLGTIGTLAVIVLFYILAKLSDKFGSVIKMPPIYRYYYLGILFLIIGYTTNLLVVRAMLFPENSRINIAVPFIIDNFVYIIPGRKTFFEYFILVLVVTAQ